MNNSNTSAILRSLIVYAVCVPLAIFVGYSLANPINFSTLSFYGILAAVLTSPIFLRWHLELLAFSWSASISCFFLPGAPNLWLVMVAVSLTISILERILSSRMSFIKVPQVTWPLMAFLVVVIFTAELTGGVGLKAFGSAVYGGKKYVLLFVSIASYFALTTRPIPKEKAGLFVTLFFAGQMTGIIGNLYAVAPDWMHVLFLIFPPSIEAQSPIEIGVTRLGAVGGAALGLSYLIMAKYGLRGIFLAGKPWRILMLAIAVVLIFLGGFRSSLGGFAAVFLMLFFWEGLHRTPMLLIMILTGALLTTAMIPLAHKLPWTFQRTLAFLPLDLDADAVNDADSSTDFRLGILHAFLPQVPTYLLLGKGLAFSTAEYDEMMTGNIMLDQSAAKFDAAQNPLALSSDFHNGMLSLLIPFGIWGVITIFWFFGAGLWVLYRNAKYGAPELQNINAVLFFLFLWEVLNFISFIAGLQITAELCNFAGYLGLSVALNNGVSKPAAQTIVPHSVQPFRRLPRPKPAFQS